MNKLILILLLLALPLISAEYLPHQIDTELQFSFSDTLAIDCNVSTADTPYGTVLLDLEMEKSWNTFNVTIGEDVFTEEGDYCFNIDCEDGYGAVCRHVTGNGKSSPDGIVVVIFIVILLAIFLFSVIYLIKAIGLIIEANLDILDVAYMWGAYFALLGVLQLANIYLGTPEVVSWLNLFVTILGFPMIIVPIFGFFISIFVSKKRENKRKNAW